MTAGPNTTTQHAAAYCRPTKMLAASNLSGCTIVHCRFHCARLLFCCCLTTSLRVTCTARTVFLAPFAPCCARGARCTIVTTRSINNTLHLSLSISRLLAYNHALSVDFTLVTVAKARCHSASCYGQALSLSLKLLPSLCCHLLPHYCPVA